MISNDPNSIELSKGSGKMYFAVTGTDGSIKFANHFFQEHFRLDPKNFTHSIFSIFTDRDANNCRRVINSIIKQPGKLEFRSNGKPGVYLHWDISAVCDETGQVKHIEFMGTDVSPVSGASNSQHRVFRENPLPQWIFDQDTLCFVDVNDAAITLYGYTREQFLQMTILDLHLADNRLGLMQEMQQDNFFDQVRKTIHQQRKSSGEIINVELNAVSYELNDRPVRQVTVVDITDRIMVQEDLASSRERYKVYLEQSSEAIWRIELKTPVNVTAGIKEIIGHCRKYGYLAECNATMAKMYGYDLPSQIEGSNLSDLIDFDDQNNIAYLTAFIESGFRLIDAESLEKDRFGNTCYFLNNLIGVIEDGFLKRAWGTQRDITERKTAEQTVLESEKRFRHVADSAPVMIWMANPANEMVYVNNPWVSLTGVNLETLQRDGWVSIIHPDDANDTIHQFNENFGKRQQVTSTYRLRVKSGEYRWVMDTGIPRKLDDGTFLGYIGSVIDIHDQKLREQKLRYQATILENVSDVIVITDLEFKIQSLNRTAEEFYGFTSEEMTGKYFSSVLKIDYSGSEQEAIEILNNNGQWKGEVSYRNKEGEIKFTLNTVSFLLDEQNNKIGVLAVGRDITDRKLAEEKMKASEVFYRNLTADSLDGILIMDESGNITFASPRVEKILGISADEGIGKPAFSFVHPDDLQKTINSFGKQISHDPGINAISIRLLKNTGEWLWCRVRGNNLLSNPYIKGIVIYFHDDTRQRQAREALKESEQRFRKLISDLQLGVIMRDVNGRAIVCNNAICSLLGKTEEDLLGKTLAEMEFRFVSEDETELPLNQHPSSRAASMGRPVRDAVIGVFRQTSNDWVWLLSNSDPILDEYGNLLSVVSTFTDITERKKIEQKLIDQEIQKQMLITRATIEGQEKERKEIGKELHDNIGQQLTTTKLYLDLAKTTADDNTLEMVSLASKSVSDVINELRTMSRSLVPPTLGDIGLIESVKDLLQPLKKMRAMNTCFLHESFNEELIPDNLKLTIFRIIQEQLNNILKHAEASLVIVGLEMQSENVILEITDDGNGFDAGARKPGLGLSNIKSRAMIFNGDSQVRTSPGNGCSVIVKIPILQVLDIMDVDEYMPAKP